MIWSRQRRNAERLSRSLASTLTEYCTPTATNRSSAATATHQRRISGAGRSRHGEDMVASLQIVGSTLTASIKQRILAPGRRRKQGESPVVANGVRAANRRGRERVLFAERAWISRQRPAA